MGFKLEGFKLDVGGDDGDVQQHAHPTNLQRAGVFLVQSCVGSGVQSGAESITACMGCVWDPCGIRVGLSISHPSPPAHLAHATTYYHI